MTGAPAAVPLAHHHPQATSDASAVLCHSVKVPVALSYERTVSPVPYTADSAVQHRHPNHTCTDAHTHMRSHQPGSHLD
jgi:hypothetical protein